MDERKRTITTPLALAWIAMVLVACGGGGSGDGPGDPGGPGGPGGGGGNSSNAPPTPSPNYVGQTGLARVTEENADAFATTVLRGVVDLIDLAHLALDEPLPPGRIDSFVSGGSGTARLSGNIQHDGRGWIAAEYSNYSVDGLTLSGLEVQHILEPITPQDGRVKIDFHNLEIRSAERRYVLHGSLDRRDVNRPAGELQLLGDVTLAEFGQAQIRVGPYSMSVERAPDAPAGVFITEVSVSGQTFIAAAGYLDINQRERLQFDGLRLSRGATPFAGELALGGSQDSRLLVTALNRHFGALLLEEGRPGEFSARQKRLDWDTEAPAAQLNGKLLLASAGPDRLVPMDRLVVLDGRFAVHRDGRFMSHRWRVVSAPPGAGLNISAADSPVTAITPFHFGTYLIEHEVSDGQTSATDTVRLFVGHDELVPEAYSLAVDVGPDLAARSGDILHLDGRRTVSPFGQSEARPNWIEFFDGFPRPSTRHLAFQARESLRPRVSADSPGYYEVTHVVSTDKPPSVGQAIQVLYIDYPWRMHKPVHLFSPAGTPLLPEDFLAADITGDGATDLAIVARGASIGNFELRFHSSAGGGHLSHGQVRSYSVAETVASMATPVLALGPANYDGQRDIYVAHGPEIHVFHQQSDWTFRHGPPLSTAAPELGPVPQGLQLIEFPVAGRPGLVRVTGSENGGVEVYLWQADESPGAPVLIDRPNIQRVAVGDLNGDGITDLVVSVQGLGEPPVLWIGRGDGAGSFAFAEQGSWDSEYFAVGDLDGDGRDDIVGVFDTGALTVLFQQSDGTLQETQIPLAGVPVGAILDLVDFDGDGRMDVVSHRGASYSALLRQSAPGSFEPAVEIPLTRGEGAVGERRREWVDFDGDGLMDAVVVDTRGHRDANGSREPRGLSIVMQTPPMFD